ncbi:MAG TPA: AbrB/MazE/SpoVT family DNA-binding domain-containing protein [Methanocella sp.]|jgi:AbrB family looped-hinge helix DNA binding protein
MVITLEDVASKLSSQNQITIPNKIRNALGLKPGDTIVFVEEDDKITVRNLKDLIKEVSATFKDFDETEKEFREGFRFDED